MPFRSRAVLEGWLDEFRLLGFVISADLRVVELDGHDGDSTGMVAFSVEHGGTQAYLEPSVEGSVSRWDVTFEAREEPVTMDAAAVAEMADQLQTLSLLAAFLQRKSTEFLEARRLH